MVFNAFQQINDPVVLEVKGLDIVEEAFRVVDGL
jgi:acetyl/propionyl-CoA carboxylase alpha subunit